MKIEKVFIMGSGLMGSGICQVCAQAGLQASIFDMNQEALEKAIKSISWSAGKLIEKGKVQGTLDEVMGRISKADSFAQAAEADLIMEVVFENIEVKREVYRKAQAARPRRTR
jgi:3-hydroxybutyryl-CoA dehydrogenase